VKNSKPKIVDPNGTLADLKAIYMEVAEEISPNAALAAMAVERQELEALIEDGKRVQQQNPELREAFAWCENNLLQRLAFLDSIAEEVAFADLSPIEPDPYRGLRLVWSNSSMVGDLAAPPDTLAVDDDIEF